MRKRLTIGFIGNFIPSFSTENERKDAFEQLGHEVVPFQENETTFEKLIEAIDSLDLLIYSHTHDPSFIIKNLKYALLAYKNANIPTASVHLDRWAGLARERDVGSEPTWNCEYVFMSDGSPEAVKLYEKHKLNWYYLAPAVSSRYCYKAKPDFERFPHKIVFTGSRGYHPEYPYRAQLIDWLRTTYGDRFGHYGNDGIKVVREHDLNVLYSSAKITIGDSCFGGRPHYVSDRYYEVRGRFGFLIHPHVEGVDQVGVQNYEHGNFENLESVINYWLNNDVEREGHRLGGFNWVRDHDTYTDRAVEMLEVIFNED